MKNKNFVVRLFNYYKKSGYRKNPIIKFLAQLFYELLVQFFHILPKKRIQVINGVKMHLDFSKKYGSFARYLGYHEVEQIEFFQNIIKENDTVLDIGAYQGDYALVAAKKVGSQGKVFAFEPLIDGIKALKKNIELNSFSNIEIIPIACSDVEGTINFNQDNARCSVENNDNSNSIIKTTTIDFFIKSKKIVPNVIKIDAEGFELKILRGMKETLSQNFTLFIELHPIYLPGGNRDVETIIKILDSNDYKIFDWEKQTLPTDLK